MKKILTVAAAIAALGFVGSAVAADMPTKSPIYKAPMMAPIYNWTGLYLGVNGGGGWSDKDWFFPGPDTTTSHNADGGIFGGQIGYRYQANAWVFGVEGMWDWASLSGSSVCPNPADFCKTKVKSLASVTGSIGYAWNAALLYVRGGAAWARDRYTVESIATGAELENASHTRSGWTIGTGFEYGFAPNWSARIAYDYYGFGTDSNDMVSSATGAFVERLNVKQNVSTVTVGLNYRFDWGR